MRLRCDLVPYAFAGIMTILISTCFYLNTCGLMAMYFQRQVDRYDDAALDISDGWEEGRNFDDYHKCVVARYFAASTEELSAYRPFDMVWMIRNWHTDFLMHQPICK